MSYLDRRIEVLTAKEAAHLLRRATFGPTPGEINSFIGLTPLEAVNRLVTNSKESLSTESEPLDLNKASQRYTQPYMDLPFDLNREGELSIHIKYWWAGLMVQQKDKPSLLEKLAAFWQNHFVVVQTEVGDYRMTYQYLQLLRTALLGNFRDLAIAVTKNAAMLLYQNGNTNEKEHPNENYARELQELFVVGQKDKNGNENFTEDDVKAAARVLTGWVVLNHRQHASTSFGVNFQPSRHDIEDKQFSSKYNNFRITGRNDQEAGDFEILELINMLLGHKESPKFICRKLYRWYVSTNITSDIELNVIEPLADFFSSSENDFKIEPVLVKLLASDIFFDQSNHGAICKSPSEFLVGMLRFFEQPLPDMKTECEAFQNLIRWVLWGMRDMQLDYLDQPSVFGFPPYYQTGYSKNWINGATLALRAGYSDSFVWPWKQIKPGYILGIDLLSWVTRLQPDFDDIENIPPISCEQVLEGLSQNLLAVELHQSQKDFIIDIIMMQGLSREAWKREWNGFRIDAANVNNTNACRYRCQVLMEYLLKMAEFHIF